MSDWLSFSHDVGTSHPRALIDVLLVGPGGDAEVTAVVDSGSDLTVCPTGLLRDLGVTFGSGMTEAVTGSGAGAYYVDSDPPFVGCLYEMHEVSIKAIGSDAADEVMLGLNDFFQHFRITFEAEMTLRRFKLEPMIEDCCSHLSSVAHPK